jgi:hypothetical protein
MVLATKRALTVAPECDVRHPGTCQHPDNHTRNSLGQQAPSTQAPQEPPLESQPRPSLSWPPKPQAVHPARGLAQPDTCPAQERASIALPLIWERPQSFPHPTPSPP